jgi:hypothetical protein
MAVGHTWWISEQHRFNNRRVMVTKLDNDRIRWAPVNVAASPRRVDDPPPVIGRRGGQVVAAAHRNHHPTPAKSAATASAVHIISAPAERTASHAMAPTPTRHNEVLRLAFISDISDMRYTSSE